MVQKQRHVQEPTRHSIYYAFRFDLQEWVEEIEREDCFAVNISLGGAPPIQKRAYAIYGWLMHLIIGML